MLCKTTNSRLLAAQAVFNTYELAEAIMLELPIQDYLLVANLNKTCAAVFMTSSVLGKEMREGLISASPPSPAFSTLPNRFTKHEPVPDFLVINLGKRDLWIRRVNGFEAIAILRKAEKPSRARPILVNKAKKELLIYVFHREVHFTKNGDWSGEAPDWAFTFYGDGDRDGVPLWHEVRRTSTTRIKGRCVSGGAL